MQKEYIMFGKVEDKAKEVAGEVQELSLIHISEPTRPY